MTVMHLRKFLRSKMDIPNTFQVRRCSTPANAAGILHALGFWPCMRGVGSMLMGAGAFFTVPHGGSGHAVDIEV